MPLIVSEREAVDVIVRRMKLGRGGNKNFLREELGAHAEQAKRLSDIAERVVVDGPDVLDTLLPVVEDDPAPVQVAREVDGRELSLTLKADRLPITSFEELVDFFEIDTSVWRPTTKLFNFWGSESNPNFQVRAKFEQKPYEGVRDEDREAFRQWALAESPDWADAPYLVTDTSDRQLLEIMVSDLHADRFTVDGYGVSEARRRMFEGISLVYQQACDSYALDKVVLVLNGDTFNRDNAAGTTSNGTPQDNDGSWREAFVQMRSGISIIVGHIAKSMPVEVRVLWGNHDREKAFYLADSLWAYFHAHPNVTVVTDGGERQYLEWGDNLIGFTHGDRVKPVDLALTMLREAPTQGKVNLQWHLGHIHTAKADEIHGVLLRWFRSPAEPDEWSNKQAFGHNGRDITGIVWDKQDGDIAEFRANFNQLRGGIADE